MERNIQGLPEELARVIQDGLHHGVSEQQIIKGMVSLGNFAEKVARPDNPEEALIMTLWDEATDDEKETLARIVFRVGKRHYH